MTDPSIVVLGKLLEPYGVKGWVRVHAFGDDPQAWAKVSSWRIGREGESVWSEIKLSKLRLHGDGVVALFDGVADRTGAEALKGLLIGLPKDSLPPTEADEYYWADLIGLEVVNTLGESLGRVANLIETGANDVLCVAAGDGEERLLPFVDAVVLAVERDAGRIRVEWGSDW